MNVDFREPDAIDLQELREMTASNAWRLYVSRIAQMIGADVKALIASDDERRSTLLQGGIRRLEAVLTLPSIMEGEIKQRVKKNAVAAEGRR